MYSPFYNYSNGFTFQAHWHRYKTLSIVNFDMKCYFKSGLEECCQRLEIKYPKLLQHFKEVPPGQMNEFRQFYKERGRNSLQKSPISDKILFLLTIW